ncbi:glycosyltransferase family 87 protein [Bradyrhizobium sp. UFLA05-109]
MRVRAVLAALAIAVLAKAAWFSAAGALQPRGLVDFDDFYIVAQRVWSGDVGQAYQLDRLLQMQIETFGISNFMPWAYPPQFDLVIAPLALLPLSAAYFLFTAATLTFYLATLRSLAGNALAVLLVVLLPALAVTLDCGQNGFLAGGLIGLICLKVERKQIFAQIIAGLALGAMVIKPHLAATMVAYLVLTRRWMALATAAMAVLASSLLCTLLLGPEIWTALFGAFRDQATYLAQGDLPLYRMISFYAALRSLGAAPALAFAGQIIVASLALLSIVLAVAREAQPRTALGVAALASVMVSPYAYDYDLPIAGIGLALLLSDLLKAASAREQGATCGLIFAAGSYGMLLAAGLRLFYDPRAAMSPPLIPSLGGLAMVALLALVLLRLRLWPSRHQMAKASP